MNTDFLINGVLRSVLGGRRKRSSRALRYLTGGGSSLLSNPTTLLTAAGVAWGIFETLQESGAGDPAARTVLGGVEGGVPGPGAAEAPLPAPPRTGSTGGPPATDEAMRLVRLAISAAYADGAMSEEDHRAVLQQADTAGVRDLVDTEIQRRRPLAEIVSGVTDTAQRATLYVLAFSIVRADEQVGGADRIYLAQLAHLLGLDPATARRLEEDTSRRIDAQDDGGLEGRDSTPPALS